MSRLPDGFCVLPWISMHASTTGDLAPCCEFDGSVGNLRDTSLQEAWQSPQWQEIRRKFATNAHVKECWKCHDREKNEGSSMRLESNRGYADWWTKLAAEPGLLTAAPKHPATYDLRFSNLCNFSCRSCWHGSSSSWFKDAGKLGLTAGQSAEIRSFAGISDVLEQIGPGLGHVEEFYFAGGEPLMMEEHFALLNRLVETGRTNVRLRYNTNLSRLRFKQQSILDLWKHFPSLQVVASVDAAHERGALIRQGFDWNTFVTNLAELRRHCPNAVISFGITVSVLNVLCLDDLLDALVRHCGARPENLQLHSLQSPDFYRTQILPLRLKQLARAKLEKSLSEMHAEGLLDDEGFACASAQIDSICDYMDSADSQHLQSRFASMTGRLDAIRGQDTASVLSELKPILQNDTTSDAAPEPAGLLSWLRRRLQSGPGR